ncbi:MAG: nickel pincer cofactor biosynthesis protein LarC, partial [Actinobacteria bacterium]|nr:nickel pincer cofactor biosynthesis protein LarC [Actinomycetota bacterium]
MTVLYFDCFAGAAGDMILGALIDAGAPLERVLSCVNSLGIGGIKLDVRPVIKGAVRATRVEVTVEGPGSPRTYSDIVSLLRRAELPPGVRRRALDTFELIGRAEARVHDVEVEDVHFHEVGSEDAIVDIVGCSAALEYFAPEHVTTGPIPKGSGTVEGAHGILPVPAPAVVEILRGAVLRDGGTRETITPTGAAVLRAASHSFGTAPSMRLESSGYGAGARDTDVPNVVRVLVGQSVPSDELQGVGVEPGPFGSRPNIEAAVVVETNVDDMSPELLAPVVVSLIEAGAQDAWITPVVMKKGRPGFTLAALTSAPAVEGIVSAMFRETTTLGVRQSQVQKEALERDWVTVEVADQHVSVKLGR